MKRRTVEAELPKRAPAKKPTLADKIREKIMLSSMSVKVDPAKYPKMFKDQAEQLMKSAELNFAAVKSGEGMT